MIAIENLTFTYPGCDHAALRDVTVSLGPGIHGFVGPSGGGKSTFLRLINGLVPHSTGGSITGSVQVLGTDVLRTPTRFLARSVGLLFQDVELQSVGQNVERDVAFGVENLGIRPEEISRRVDRALATCGITELRTRTLSSLSGGERQLAALAAVIAVESPVICLDEPLAQLDSAYRVRMMDLCHQLAAAGRTVLVSEHHEDAVVSLTDSIFTFENGRLRPGIPHRSAGASQKNRPSLGLAWELVAASISICGVPLLSSVGAAGHRGRVLALTGPNGAGKTTLLRVLAGLHPLSDGGLHRNLRHCAYLPQNPASLLWRKSIRTEIETTLKQRGGGSVDAVLDEFSLTPIASQYPADVSTGERQRAALATVLCGEPELLLLDEPTRGMDHRAFADLVRAVNSAADRGACVVIATHDDALIGAVADSELHLSDGAAIMETELRASSRRATAVQP